ncbi:Nramp family divalent metal transporter [Marinilongibacter aquaticus]|uniref:Nramp family divalent metal transporter n=1 Tax=Marinilongibacter aquaticus TaxID=2975157 RepID=UPI0021BDC65C|nr:Nramp family divalent metal transporter [Marinilongibacter aquaticus]UBM58138.1 Nramp family divalent metal transporter [Marinilongibacter aquaticus]
MTKLLNKIGPGLLVAAAGIGAGDMIMGIQIGFQFRWLFVLAILLACILKYTITEGIAKHQLASGKSVIQRWNETMPLGIRLLFLSFLLIWSFMVGGALLSATGLAANALFPQLSIHSWALLQSLLACALVYWGHYGLVENITRLLVGLMFFILIPMAIFLLFQDCPPQNTKLAVEHIEPVTMIMAILGGVGGSVTMLSYGGWLKERKWTGSTYFSDVKTDLIFSYAITGLFLFALVGIASQIESPAEISGSKLIFLVGQTMAKHFGEWADYFFKICFWGVVFSSVLTVWSGVPYLFSDFSEGFAKKDIDKSSSGPTYRIFLLMLSLAPLFLVYTQNTLRNVINYTLISSVFVAGISLNLLFINNKKEWVGQFRNNSLTKAALWLSTIAFSLLLIWQVFQK